MYFLRFVLGGFLILGSIILFLILWIGRPFAIISSVVWGIIFWVVMGFIIFLGGIYLLTH